MVDLLPVFLSRTRIPGRFAAETGAAPTICMAASHPGARVRRESAADGKVPVFRGVRVFMRAFKPVEKRSGMQAVVWRCLAALALTGVSHAVAAGNRVGVNPRPYSSRKILAQLPLHFEPAAAPGKKAN